MPFYSEQSKKTTLCSASVPFYSEQSKKTYSLQCHSVVNSSLAILLTLKVCCCPSVGSSLTSCTSSTSNALLQSYRKLPNKPPPAVLYCATCHSAASSRIVKFCIVQRTLVHQIVQQTVMSAPVTVRFYIFIARPTDPANDSLCSAHSQQQVQQAFFSAHSKQRNKPFSVPIANSNCNKPFSVPIANSECNKPFSVPIANSATALFQCPQPTAQQAFFSAHSQQQVQQAFFSAHSQK